MLVGPGEVGKTTLAHKLLTDQFSAGQFSMTDGVAMHDWQYGSVDFQLWDFGGQEVYLNTHAMFFENRSVYVIMMNGRKLTVRDVLNKLEEYFQNVQNRAPEAPILLVSTHADSVPALSAECLAEVRSSYAVHGYYHIDCASGQGIEELKIALKDVSLQQPYVTQSIPRKYVQVQERLKGMRGSDKFSISHAEYLEVVQAVGLDVSQAELLLSLLHQWGAVHVLSGGDIVLQPQQLADVMKCVITATPAGSSLHAGILQHRDMGAVWSQYETRLHLQFLSLLHDSELAYPLYDSSGNPLSQSLVPAMLPSTLRSPDAMCNELYYDKYSENESKYGRIELQLRSRSPTFFPKLQARLRAMATRDGAWQQYYFVSLEDSVSGEPSSALLYCDLSNGKIEVRYPLKRDQACAAALCAIRSLLDEQFQALDISEVSLHFASTALKKIALLKRLQKDRNAVITSEDDEGNPCTASLSPLRVLFKELDVPQAVVDATAVSDNLPPPPSKLELLLERVRQEGSPIADLRELSSHLIETISNISGQCDVNRFHVGVIWLAMVDRAADGRSGQAEYTYLVPISPGKSSADPWVAMHELRIRASSGDAARSLEDVRDTHFATLVLGALYEVGVPRSLLHLEGGKCEWRGLVRMSAYEGALMDAQRKHFERVSTAEGASVLQPKEVLKSKMPSVAEQRGREKEEEEESRTDLHTLAERIAAVQMDSIFKVHEIPLLFCVSQPEASGMIGYFQRAYSSVFRVHFICPVCGQRAHSGPDGNGKGYKLLRTKVEVAMVAKYLQFTLKAIEVISLLTPVPLPHLSDLSNYLPNSDVVAEMGLKSIFEETQRKLCARLDSLANGESGDLGIQGNAGAGVSEVEISLSDVYMLKALLPVLGESYPPMFSGLHPVFCQQEHCAWVCKEPHRDAKGNIIHDCTKRFKEQGNQCLQIKVSTA